MKVVFFVGLSVLPLLAVAETSDLVTKNLEALVYAAIAAVVIVPLAVWWKKRKKAKQDRQLTDAVASADE